MRKCEVNYWFYLSDTIEVVADSEDAAVEKGRRMVEASEIASNLNKMPLGDSGVRVA